MASDGFADIETGDRNPLALILLLPCLTLLVGFVADLALHRALKWRDEQRLARYEKKMQLRNNMDRFEQMAEERRKSAAVVLGEQYVARRGGHLVGEVWGGLGFERGGRGGRRGVIFIHDFKLCGVWVSAFVMDGERVALESLLGVAVDEKYLETEETFEGALLLLAQASSDGAAGMVFTQLCTRYYSSS